MVTKAEFEAAITRIAFLKKEMLRLKKVEDENGILIRKVADLEASPTAQAPNWSKFH